MKLVKINVQIFSKNVLLKIKNVPNLLKYSIV